MQTLQARSLVSVSQQENFKLLAIYIRPTLKSSSRVLVFLGLVVEEVVFIDP